MHGSLAFLVSALLLVTATDVAAQSPTSGGGGVDLGRQRCLDAEQRRDIHFGLRRRQRAMAAVGILPLSTFTPFDLATSHPSTHLRWPVRAAGSAAADPGVHAISNFVDQNAGAGVLDYQCGARTYDGHRGTDIFSWPYSWNRMASDEVEIVSGADGVILAKTDGNFDMSCAWTGGQWNAVYVQHFDGSVAWYGHLKKNSLTTKVVGQLVAEGEYLGVMGSSGYSTGVHLHLELYNTRGQIVDPYNGPCDPGSPYAWWRAERSYYDSAINRIQVGPAAAVLAGCPNPDTPNDQGVVARGSLGYFTAFYRDQLAGQVSQFVLRRPNGTVYHSWTGSSTVAHYAASWWWWSWSIGTGQPAGTWTFEVTYQGATHEVPFTVV